MDENNNYETQKEQDYEFLEKEHKAGFHQTYTEKCSICWSENARIQKWKLDMQDRSLIAHKTN